MNYVVRITPEVNQRLRAIGLGRGIVRILNAVYRLDTEADRHRHNRVPGQPDRFRFRFRFIERLGAGWHNFEFVVNDQDQPGHLFVIDFEHEYRPPP